MHCEQSHQTERRGRRNGGAELPLQLLLALVLRQEQLLGAGGRCGKRVHRETLGALHGDMKAPLVGRLRHSTATTAEDQELSARLRVELLEHLEQPAHTLVLRSESVQTGVDAQRLHAEGGRTAHHLLHLLPLEEAQHRCRHHDLQTVAQRLQLCVGLVEHVVQRSAAVLISLRVGDQFVAALVVQSGLVSCEPGGTHRVAIRRMNAHHAAHRVHHVPLDVHQLPGLLVQTTDRLNPLHCSAVHFHHVGQRQWLMNKELPDI
mmetsp:Transcript_16569/g.42393  ORF Transcript_16569/g.42393 Transcript_16569/m.42393 type:complete len:262 (+) Transcript_16569:50-835(+)